MLLVAHSLPIQADLYPQVRYLLVVWLYGFGSLCDIAIALPAEQQYGDKDSSPTNETPSPLRAPVSFAGGRRVLTLSIGDETMKFAKKMSLTLSIAAAMTFSAHAQSGQAKFKLPHDARLGNAVLPAGEYMMRLSMEGNVKAYIVPEGKGSTMIVLPVSTDEYAGCSASSVSMQHTGSVWSIRSICFADSQIALYFAMPAEKEALAKAAPAPVAVAEGR